MNYFRKLALSVIVLLSGCSVVNSGPPFADPNKTNQYSIIRSDLLTSHENIWVAMTKADGRSAVTPSHNVDSMILEPGVRIISAWCYKGSINLHLGMDLKINMKNGKTYSLGCELDKAGTGASFTLTDLATEQAVEFEVLGRIDGS